MQKRSPIKRTAGIELWVQQDGCRNKSVSYPSPSVGIGPGLRVWTEREAEGKQATWELQPDQKSKK
jgi:hypothetical protein